MLPRVLATDSVKWTGEGVAAVVAETPEQAVDALEAIVVDWEPLPAVVDAEKAMEPGAPQLHENAPNNVVFEWTVGDKAGTDAAIDGAEVVVRQRIVNQRLIPNPMETRGDIGSLARSSLVHISDTTYPRSACNFLAVGERGTASLSG